MQALWTPVKPRKWPPGAKRSEEAGLTLGALHPVSEVYASPGNSTEFYYIYLGLADLPDSVTLALVVWPAKMRISAAI